MTVPILHIVPQSQCTQTRENDFGETPLAYAPTVRMSNGKEAVPQQYLDVNRTLSNLSSVLTHISVPTDYQLFAGEEGSCLYLIVGVIGKENYPRSAEAGQMDKMVYGRRWLIEPTTPTSEIIQTALLAIKKVREHEVRELLTVRINQGSRVTTPFNCHLDLPLMAGSKPSFAAAQAIDVDSQLIDLNFAGYSFSVTQRVQLANKLVLEPVSYTHLTLPTILLV